MCAGPANRTQSLATLRPAHVGSRIVAHRFGIPAIGLVGVGITVHHHLSPRREDLAARINATVPVLSMLSCVGLAFPTIAASEEEGEQKLASITSRLPAQHMAFQTGCPVAIPSLKQITLQLGLSRTLPWQAIPSRPPL